VTILDEYQRLRAANPAFDPVRPVLAANVRPHERDAGVPLITDPLTARVTDLFNVVYEILLQIFERYFAHTEETDGQLQVLADATVALMLRVVKPLGDLITTLPVGAEHPGRSAGPSFELFYESDYLMPHRTPPGRCSRNGWTRQRGCAARSGQAAAPASSASSTRSLRRSGKSRRRWLLTCPPAALTRASPPARLGWKASPLRPCWPEKMRF
jgi:hypothetical protein